MGAPRAWVSIGGQTPAGKEIVINGEEAMRKVRFHPDLARLTIDTASSPPQIVVAPTDVVAALTARVEVLEAIVSDLNVFLDRAITETGNVFKLKNPQGDVCLVLGETGLGAAALRFFGDSAPVGRPSVSASSGTVADDLLQALHNAGIINKTE